MKTYTVLHVFSGMGGCSLGFSQARGHVRGLDGQFETLGAIDNDPAACAAYKRITGQEPTCWDLFDREQWTAFNGHEPPSDWHEITHQDMLATFGVRSPDVVMLSPPCKGFSALLPQKSASKAKYQALNQLVIRALMLVLEAWPSGPGLILLENVPRIRQRGARLLAQVRGLLEAHGYAIHDADHCAGAIGGLAQRRRRFLLLARNTRKVKPFVYRPVEQPLRSVGDVLGQLPMPDSPECGRMHRMSRLQWITWLRLACIRPGHDWRDLVRGSAVALHHCPRNGVYHIAPWSEPCGVVAGAEGVGRSNTVSAVADPRLPQQGQVTGDSSWSDRPGLMGVNDWAEPCPTVTCQASVSAGNGSLAVADPRVKAQDGRHLNHMHVTDWEEASGTITGATHVNNGGAVVADPRLGCSCRAGSYGVLDWLEPGRTITSADVHAGCAAIADPRQIVMTDRPDPPPVIIAPDGTWHRPLTDMELMALQGFPVKDEHGWIELECSSAKARELVGNAIPPPSARAIAEQILLTLLNQEAGVTFELSGGTPWVGGEMLCG